MDMDIAVVEILLRARWLWELEVLGKIRGARRQVSQEAFGKWLSELCAMHEPMNKLPK